MLLLTTNLKRFLPQKISHICSSFLRLDGVICGTVTVTCRYSGDLGQGSMEIPCQMKLKGMHTKLQKIKKFFLSAFSVEIIIVSAPMIDDAPALSLLLFQI